MTEIEQLMYDLLDGLPKCDEEANAEAAATLFDVLPYLGRALGLQGLACLAATCTQLKHECVKFIHQNARLLLLDLMPRVETVDCLTAAAEAAADSAAEAAAAAAADQRLQPVLWLLRIAPPFSSTAWAAGVLQRLVHLPNVTLQRAGAQQLVAAGVRISYAQLVSAARSMVAGVEVWVQALQQQGVASDLPAAAVKICCEDWVSLHLTVSCQLGHP
jgi:hypothetical protein